MYVCVCTYDEKMEFRSVFFFWNQIVDFLFSCDSKQNQTNKSIYSRKFRHVCESIKAECSVVLNQVFALTPLDPLVKFI